VSNNFFTNGFDRAVGFTMRSSEGLRGERESDRWHLARDLLIQGNTSQTFSATSCFGGSSPTNHKGLPVTAGNTGIRIIGNYCRDITRTLVRMAELTEREGDMIISSNHIEGDHDGILFAGTHPGFSGTILVDGNVSVGARPEYTDYQPLRGTINVTGKSRDCSAVITRNVVADAAGACAAVAVDCPAVIRDNLFRNCTLPDGIRLLPGSDGSTVSGNRFFGNPGTVS
jgi:hypothetical protein